MKVEDTKTIPEDQLVHLKVCPLCGFDKFEDFFTDVQVERPTTSWRLCVGCAHVFVSPQPSMEWLGDYYDHGYRAQAFRLEKEDKDEVPTRSTQEEAHRAYRITNTMLRFQPLVERALDIGSSTGVLMAGIFDRWTVERGVLVEPNKAWREFSQLMQAKTPDHMDAKVDVYSWLSEVPKSPKFDLITCSHALEHMTDPISALKTMHKLLRKRGFLYIETPNLFGGVASPLVFPHLHAFHMETLIDAIEIAGFHVVQYETHGCFPPFWPSPQHHCVIAQMTPVEYSVKTMLRRWNLYRDHTAFVKNVRASARPGYEVG